MKMKRDFLAVVGALTVLSAGAGERIWRNLPETDPNVRQIRTTAFAVGFDVSKKGEIAWMKSCLKGVDFAAGAPRPPLFRLKSVPADPDKRGACEVTAADAGSFECVAFDRRLRLVFGAFPEAAAVERVECTVSCERNDNFLYWDLAFVSKPGWKVVWQEYPRLPARSGAREGSYLLAEPMPCGGRYRTSCWDLAPGEKADDALAARMRASRDVEAVDAGEGAPRVLVLGNSITGTGPANRWDGCWGMMASWPEKDFVHLVVAGLEKRWNRRVSWRRHNLAQWERNLATWDMEKKLAADRAFKPEWVIVALGENVPTFRGEADRKLFETKTVELVRQFKREGVKVVIRSPFWEKAGQVQALRAAAAETGSVYADLKNPVTDERNKALGSTDDPGVAGHPGDEGMRQIADAILKAID